MSEVSCPRCNSKRVSVYEKEIQAGWTLGLPKVAEYRRGAKETFKELGWQIIRKPAVTLLHAFDLT